MNVYVGRNKQETHWRLWKTWKGTEEISRKQIGESWNFSMCFVRCSDPTVQFTMVSDPTNCTDRDEEMKLKHQKSKKQTKEKRRQNSQHLVSTASAVIIKSRLAEQQLITRRVEMQGEVLSSRTRDRQGRLEATAETRLWNRARKRKCVYFQGIIKRVVQHPWRGGDRTKVRNNVSDTTFVWLCPRALLHPLTHLHPQPLKPPSPDLQQPALIRVSAADSDS